MLRRLVDLREMPSAAAFERHPWEVARADFFVEALAARTTEGPVAVLDVGGGDGYVGRRLLQALPAGSAVTCFDPNYTPEQIDRLTAAAPPELRFTASREGSPADWLLMLDVLEHVADDVDLLRGFTQERLRPGGHALLSVPAWPRLFTQHDVMLGHHRRYVPGQLERVAASAGLVEVESGSLFSALLVPRAIAKVAERARGVASSPLASSPADHASTEVGTWRGAPALTAALTWTLRQDFRVARALSRRGLRLPGLSLWCLARKPLSS